MNRSIATAVFSIASLFTLGNASAQNLAAKATVPFAFSVGSTIMPAGTYLVSSPDHGQLVIKSTDLHSMAITMTSQLPTPWAGAGQLVFTKYGDQYFLHAVNCPVAGMNARIPTSTRESRVEFQQASRGHGVTILVAAR